MHQAKSNKLIYSFFSWFISFLVQKDFKSFQFNRVNLEEDKSVLLLANHFSWWDGFLLFYLNKVYLKKRFCIMISEENYRQVWFFKYLGAFSIKRNSRSALESILYSARLLDNPENLVVIFPQGKLHSQYVDEITFEQGVFKIINSSNKRFQYLFVSMFVEYFESAKPTVNCCLQVSKPNDYDDSRIIKGAYNNHYQTSRKKQSRITL